MDKELMIQTISQHEVFKDVGSKSVGRIGEIIDYKTVKKNNYLFNIGDQPNLIYLLLKGSLTLRFPDNSKLELEPGELIGEIGLLNGDFRLGALTANEDSELISICGTRIFDTNYIPAETSLSIVRKLGKRVTNYLKSTQQTSTKELITKGENEFLEFKSTLRWNLKANRKDTRITHAILKTIAAFLNSEGGTLLVGVSDNGDILGLDSDLFENQDKILLFLTNIIKSQLGTLHIKNLHFHIEQINDKSVLRIDVQGSQEPCYLSTEKMDHFYIRTGPSTTDLRLSKVYEYIKKRFQSN